MPRKPAQAPMPPAVDLDAPADWAVAGELVSIPVVASARRHWHLDGFYRSAPACSLCADAAADGATGSCESCASAHPPLLVFVHGMGSNFYRSALKKAFLQAAPLAGLPILSVNNSGADAGTVDERFGDCIHDLDAIRDWALRHHHSSIVWIGHSTGCQKATYWQARRQDPATAAVVLLAPADDNAILERDLGPRRLAQKIEWAHRQIAAGRPEAVFEQGYERFSARRFLSVAEASRPEASVFRYAGRLAAFRKLRCPVLAAFGENEEFAAIPPREMLDRLAAVTRSDDFTDWLIPETGHSFREAEEALAVATCEWIWDTFEGGR